VRFDVGQIFRQGIAGQHAWLTTGTQTAPRPVQKQPMIGIDGMSFAEAWKNQLAAAAVSGKVMVVHGAHGDHARCFHDVPAQAHRRAPARASQIHKISVAIAVVMHPVAAVEDRTIRMAACGRILRCMRAIRDTQGQRIVAPMSAQGIDQHRQIVRIPAHPRFIGHHDHRLPQIESGIFQKTVQALAERAEIDHAGGFGRADEMRRPLEMKRMQNATVGQFDGIGGHKSPDR